MKHKLLLLANPNGRNVTPERIKKLQEIFLLDKGKLQITFKVTENLSQLEKVIEQHRKSGITILGVFGGDGTVMHTRTLAEERWGYHPTYAFFPLGTMNNIQRAVGLYKDDSSLKLARHIVDVAGTDSLDKFTISMPSLDIDGRKGFNIGLGIIPRLLWMYYGHSAKHYWELEGALQTCALEEYQSKYKEITGKLEEDFFDLLSKERGLWGAAKAALRLLKGSAARDERYILNKSLAGEVIFDGKRHTFPKSPLGAYISCYEGVNLGLGRFNPIASPGANKEEGKFQVVVPCGDPFSIAYNLPQLIAGKKISNAVYEHLSSLELPAERIAQVDGEFILEKGFTVRQDGTRKIIILP
ncbi:MAG: diacylglycerol kinase family protein [Nanoarchaeota archaeon]